MKIKAAVAYAGETGFRYEDVELEDPRPNEILVEIEGVGLCHTDLVVRSGEASFPFPFPAVLGHEGSGIVHAVGKDVTKVKPGDHIVMTFRSCETCDRCHSHDPSYCRTMPQLNFAGAVMMAPPRSPIAQALSERTSLASRPLRPMLLPMKAML